MPKPGTQAAGKALKGLALAAYYGSGVGFGVHIAKDQSRIRKHKKNKAAADKASRRAKAKDAAKAGTGAKPKRPKGRIRYK